MQTSLQTICRNLPVLEHGAKTTLYQALHELSRGPVAC